MPLKDKESLASELLSFSFGDAFKEWRDAYPLVDEIEALASDLSWSNAIDVDDDWEKLIKYINDLDHEVNRVR